MLPAAARPARARRRRDHALADAGAVRPARGARAGRALPGASCARCARRRTRWTSPACARAGTTSWRPSWRRSRDDYARAAAALRGAGRRPARRARALRGVDLGRHPRGAAAAGHRRRRAPPGRPGDRVATAPASARGAAASGCPSARTRRGWTRCSRRPGVHATCVDLTDVLGRGAPEQLRPLAQRGRPAAGADGPRDRRAGVERRRLPRARGLPRLPPPHDPPPPRRGPTTAAPTTARRARAQAREHAADFVARVARARAPAAACASARSTPSCSGTGGTRGLVAGRRARRGRRAGARARLARRRARAPRAGRRAARPARDDLGHAARPLDLGRARAWPISPGARATPSCARSRPGRRAGARALRELLALQASDWAFMVSRDLAGPYPRERAAGHRRGARRGAAARLWGAARPPKPRAGRSPRPASPSCEPSHPDPVLGVPAADRGRPGSPRAQALRAARGAGRRGPRPHARRRVAWPPRRRSRASASTASASRGARATWASSSPGSST